MDKRNRQVIIVTDGDGCAQRAVERATRNIGGRCISRSGGNPTPIIGKEIVDLVMTAKNDPVVVMVDDMGDSGTGHGELALEYLLHDNCIDVIGVVAVASNTREVDGVVVDFSITKDGRIVEGAVNKLGNAVRGDVLQGDTVDVLRDVDVPLIVGIGDVGKMMGKDDCEIGAPIITRAMEEIMSRSTKHETKK